MCHSYACLQTADIEQVLCNTQVYIQYNIWANRMPQTRKKDSLKQAKNQFSSKVHLQKVY